MASKWDAKRRHMQAPHDYEHIGISGTEAVRRIVDLNSAVQESGVTKFVPAHLKQLAPCLVMLPLES